MTEPDDKTLHTRALEHGRAAFGAGLVREGVGLTPEDDLLFALGWPHLRYLDDAHRDNRRATKMTETAVSGSMEGHYGTVWPTEVASRYVRAYGSRPRAFTTRSAPVKEAVAIGGVEVDEASAREWLASIFTRLDISVGAWDVEHFVLLLEAFVGPDLVLEGLVSGIESAGSFPREEEMGYAAYTVGWLMLRVSPEAAHDARARLAAVRDRREDGQLKNVLVRVLGDADAVKALSLNPRFYHHVLDDPDAVVAAVEAGRWLPSVRLVYLGGERVLEAFAPHWRRHRERELQRKLVEGLARLRSPVATRILEEMAASSKVRKQAAAALAARG